MGGFDLAAHWMGWENSFHCEWNKFGRQILSYYWPNAKSYEDITKTDFSIHRGRIGILTGGFPCQPYSQAGNRKGKDDERHLWPQMLRAIREIRPRWVVGENVLGLVNWNEGMVFHEVQSDLEAEGYEVQPYVLPACSVNAPHRRDRVWFVAKDTNQDGRGSDQRKEGTEKRGQRDVITGDNERVPTDHGKTRSASNTKSGRPGGIRDTKKEAGSRKGDKLSGSKRGMEAKERDASNASGPELQGSEFDRGSEKEREIKGQGRQFSGSIPPIWEKFPTQPPICNGNDGLPTELDGITFSKWRSESLKAGGNAIVPQVALQIFKAIERYENT